MGIDHEEDAGALEPELGLHALTTALARVMDAVPAELILCTAAGVGPPREPPRAEAREGRGERNGGCLPRAAAGDAGWV